MTAIIILNIVFVAAVVVGIVGLLAHSIHASHRHDAAALADARRLARSRQHAEHRRGGRALTPAGDWG